ncbi:MAG: xanthine dehydrogenase family protein subunit M [Chloroflexi bacterium]|nr:xanthine dehydrogenase family protein subunit M [Chloroflexota bacterium]
MKPPAFEYLSPRSSEEALSILAEQGEEAKLLAGGQSLMPLLNFRLTRPGMLVDLNRIAGLDTLTYDGATGEVVFGPMVRQIDAERSPLVQSHCPLLVEALKHIGHRAIRNRGTVGGSLAHADPAAELPLMLVALGGRVKLASRRGERWLPAEELFLSYLTTAIEPDEMLAEARFPAQAPTAGWAFEEFSRRHGDFALAAAAVVVGFDEAGQIAESAIAIAGGGATPLRATVAEQALRGRRPGRDVVVEASNLASAACEPEPDIHGSVEYRRALIATLVERALVKASAQVALV